MSSLRIAGVLLTLMTCEGAPAAEETHWAFRPLADPEPPAVQDEGWVRNPIDRFILAGLEEFGLEPSPEAGKLEQLRRLCFDLTGLPPTVEEQDRFLADASPGAYERLVDRLLADPRYGERWAQHWLDLARYADTDGYEFDEARPGMWRYRDWVVRALNDDLPYDRFVTLQMAGDEVSPGDDGAAIATGFHRCYADMVDMNDQAERRQIALDDITETTGSVFLGLTIGCARCHDHKFDPLTQVDFYRLQAVFSPSTFVNDRPAKGGDDREPIARVLAELGPKAEPTYLRIRGQFSRPGPEVSPGVPAVLGASPEVAPTAHSTGRRAALAAWLCRPDHPLTTRVIVNRVWQHHFGRGIAATSSDFGTMGSPPTHPELLDWLSRELPRRGWSLKELHRLIVTSAAYRMSSRSNPEAAPEDPDNELFWRQNRQRLDGEAVRDALLSASGLLSDSRGGPGVFPELPPELAKLSGKGAAWPVSATEQERDRRSLYVFVRRNLRYPLFEVFDRPDTNASCPNRPVTTIAPQALTLLNDPLTHRAAEALAARVTRERENVEERLELAFRSAVGRRPDAAERETMREFVEGGDGLAPLALALFNLNEFIYVD